MRIRRDGGFRRRWLVAIATVLLGYEWSAAAAAVADPVPSGTVSLEAAVAAALASDPTLAAQRFEEEARRARARQDGRLRNPTFSTEVENVARSGGDTARAEAPQVTVSMAQVIELGGKRSRRVEMAERDASLARWDYEQARRDTIARVRRAFVAALLAQEQVGLAVRRRDLARAALAATRRYRDAGSGSEAEVARAAAVLAQMQALVARRERERGAAHGALAATWGATSHDIGGVAGRLAPLPVPVALDVLRARLATQPELVRFGDALARDEAGVAFEKARRIPDVSVRLGARRFVDAESNALVAEVSVPLPIFDRNADAVAEAEARLDKTRAERRGAEVAASTELRREHAELCAAYAEARVLGTDVVPRLETALGETRRAYAAGTIRQLDVLDAERALADAEEERLAALARFHTTAAEVERLTGASVTGGGR